MANTTYVRNQLYTLKLADLQPDPEQPRKYMDPEALQELTESVRQHNVLEPILFRKDPGGRLIVVAGEMRCAAACAAGLATVPGIFIDSGNYREISLIENILRSNLTPVEEAEALDRLMVGNAYQQDDLVRIFSKSKTSISETLSLTKLPQAVRDECRKDPSIPKRVLIGIARKKQERSMLTAYNKYKLQISAAETTRTRTATDPVQNVFNAFDAVARRIDTFMAKFTEQSPEDLDRFVAGLEGFHQALGNAAAEAKKQAKAVTAAARNRKQTKAPTAAARNRKQTHAPTVAPSKSAKAKQKRKKARAK